MDTRSEPRRSTRSSVRDVEKEADSMTPRANAAQVMAKGTAAGKRKKNTTLKSTSDPMPTAPNNAKSAPASKGRAPPAKPSRPPSASRKRSSTGRSELTTPPPKAARKERRTSPKGHDAPRSSPVMIAPQEREKEGGKAKKDALKRKAAPQASTSKNILPESLFIDQKFVTSVTSALFGDAVFAQTFLYEPWEDMLMDQVRAAIADVEETCRDRSIEMPPTLQHEGYLHVTFGTGSRVVKEKHTIKVEEENDIVQNILPVLRHYWQQGARQSIELSYRFGQPSPTPIEDKTKKRATSKTAKSASTLQQPTIISSDPVTQTDNSTTPKPRKANEKNKEDWREGIAVFEQIKERYQCNDRSCSNSKGGGVVGCLVMNNKHYELLGKHVGLWRQSVDAGESTASNPSTAVIAAIMKHTEDKEAAKGTRKQGQQLQQLQQPAHPQWQQPMPWWMSSPWMNAAVTPSASAPPPLPQQPTSSPPRSASEDPLYDYKMIAPYCRWLRRLYPDLFEQIDTAKGLLTAGIWTMHMVKKEADTKVEKVIKEPGLRRLMKDNWGRFITWTRHNAMSELDSE